MVVFVGLTMRFKRRARALLVHRGSLLISLPVFFSRSSLLGPTGLVLTPNIPSRLFMSAAGQELSECRHAVHTEPTTIVDR